MAVGCNRAGGAVFFKIRLAAGESENTLVGMSNTLSPVAYDA